MKAIRIHPSDDVAVALTSLKSGDQILGTELREDIRAGHKFALGAVKEGERVRKYGMPIGRAIADIHPGAWVHTHNLRTNLDIASGYAYEPAPPPACPPMTGSFWGYARRDGRVGVRNELWILPTVGCINRAAGRIADRATRELGVPAHAFAHPYGCSQLGEDHLRTQRLLCALSRHPNAGGALILGLGCENNGVEAMQAALGSWDEDRVKFLRAQDAEDEVEAALELLRPVAERIRSDARTEQPLSRLVLGLKCGGSDGLSGITANPLLGAVTDGVCAAGGAALMTEVPEMFGAEAALLARCRNRGVFDDAVRMIDGFKRYYEAHGQPIYENPSPGNKSGGITTLEEKSLGCVQKGGTGAVSGVLDCAEPWTHPGLSLISGPGNDGCAITALTAAGAQIVLFTTGRGTPMGAPAPTLKIATNRALAARKPGWIDFDAGVLAEGAEMVGTARASFVDP